MKSLSMGSQAAFILSVLLLMYVGWAAPNLVYNPSKKVTMTKTVSGVPVKSWLSTVLKDPLRLFLVIYIIMPC